MQNFVTIFSEKTVEETKIASSVSNIWIKCSGMTQVSKMEPVTVSYRSDERVWKVQMPDLKKVWDGALSESFLNCRNLSVVGLESLHTVHKYGMQRCFAGCVSLSNVTNSYTIPVYEVRENGFEYAFFNCYKLPELHFPYLSIIESGSFAYAFRKCADLKTISFDTLETCGKSSFTSAFYQCYGLNDVGFPELKEVLADGFQNAFNSCTSLRLFVLPNIRVLKEDAFRSAFRNCDSIQYIILYNPDGEYEFSDYAFRNAFEPDSKVTFIVPEETYTEENDYPMFLQGCGLVDVPCLYRSPVQKTEYVKENLPETDSSGNVIDVDGNVLMDDANKPITSTSIGQYSSKLFRLQKLRSQKTHTQAEQEEISILTELESALSRVSYTEQTTQKVSYTYHVLKRLDETGFKDVYRLRDDTNELIQIPIS